MFKSLVAIIGIFISFSTFADVMNVYIEKEIDDDNIIVVTAKGDRLLLEKWTMKLSPLLFEGKIFPADISPLWVKMYIEGKGEIKWSVEDHLGTVDLNAKTDTTKPKAPSVQGYPIEIANNDELFIINGETFKAQTYCLGWETGEQVKFIEGSPYGACASAKLLNLNRGETCDVWCE
ncbi:hypothetical protein [Photobacterium ganghwense]|uniref:hypothetical protein n=2 Tax=Photobacterium ganghwense TaxID=320778 RepID=UPI00069EA018|nr:hypothetical protein [Photobacterium ganghwense]